MLLRTILQSSKIVVTIIIFSIGIIIIRCQLTTHKTVDFIEYWSAAKLAITGGNPYSTQDMLRIEQENG